MTRLRLILLILSLIATAALAASWIRTLTHIDTLRYTWGSAAPGAPLPDQEGPAWDYRFRFIRLYHVDGVLGISLNAYTSFGNDEDGVRRWSEQPSWQFSSARNDIPRAAPAADRWYQPLSFLWRGFRCGHGSRQGTDITYLSVPHWFAILLAASPAAAITLASLRTRRRRRAGVCTACGYTLAGLEVCPECGPSRGGPGTPKS